MNCDTTKQGASDIHNAKVHFARVVVKYSQTADLPSEIIGISFGVLALNAKQHEDALSDRSCNVTVHFYARLGDALQNGSH